MKDLKISFLTVYESCFKDKKLFGRPITATTDDNISKIQAFIKSDQYCTYNKIEAEFQISRENIHTIIYN
jgi:hypothetical protein